MSGLPVWLIIMFVLLACTGVTSWLLGFRYDNDMRPLPTARFLVTQGRVTYMVDSEEEAAEMALNYGGVTRVERRNR